MRQKLSVLAILLLLFLAACDLIQDTPSAPTPTASATANETSGSAPVLQSTPDIAVPITVTETTPSLTIWIPPDTILGAEAGTAVFSDQLRTFNINHPELETRVEQKPVDGQGGILSYLRAGANVAPSILPDLILLPTGELTVAASEGLIYPLDGLLDPAALDDLYPAARALARSQEQTVGYPYAINNLTHLAYQTNVISSTPPLRWSELTTLDDTNFIFPAAGDAGAILVLQFYLMAGGELENEAGQPMLDAPPLAQALQQLSQARSNGFILPQSSNANTLLESWDVFQSGTAVFALTSAEQFLTQRTPETTPGYAVIAGLDSPLTPLIDGWAWAIATNDPMQRLLAGELLAALIDGPSMGAWTLQSSRLPARRQALTVWPHDDAYLSFIHLELERAQPNPITAGSPIMEALSNAVFDVISLTKTPQEAAEEAVIAVQP